MGGDMVAALGRATQDGHTLFGHNIRQPGRAGLTLHRSVGRTHAPEEKIDTHGLILPQARQTMTAVGVQVQGQWGYDHGVNLCGVAAGCTAPWTRLAGERPGLLGSDLVRLGLERARTARQAVDLVCDLICRHGQGMPSGRGGGDSALLIADGREAFALETAGPYWVYQEIREARAMTDLCTVRQDWDAIARGLASFAIEHGWWPGDGSKLDFAGVVAPEPDASGHAWRRWGRATLLLEQQNGHMDLAFIRRLLSDHFEGCPDEVDPLAPEPGPTPLCLHGQSPDASATASSLVVQLQSGGQSPRIAWCCPGPPCTGVYLPVLFEADLPAAFGSTNAGADNIYARTRHLLQEIGYDHELWDLARDSLARLQARIDQETEEFLQEAGKSDQATSESSRRAGLFMQHVLECYEEATEAVLRQRPLPVLASQEA
jgi:dipeptidase